jgi:hypothetical protein
VEQKRKDTLNIAVAEMAGWGSSMLELKMMTQPARKASKAEMSSLVATNRLAEQSITLRQFQRV